MGRNEKKDRRTEKELSNAIAQFVSDKKNLFFIQLKNVGYKSAAKEEKKRCLKF